MLARASGATLTILPRNCAKESHLWHPYSWAVILLWAPLAHAFSTHYAIKHHLLRVSFAFSLLCHGHGRPSWSQASSDQTSGEPSDPAVS